jgi:hypothetical protein
VAERLNAWSDVLTSDTNLIYIDMGGQPAGEYPRNGRTHRL